MGRTGFRTGGGRRKRIRKRAAEKMTGTYWVSNQVMTVGVTCERGIITEGPLIIRKFMGQRVDNLFRWLNNMQCQQIPRKINGQMHVLKESGLMWTRLRD